MGCTAADGAILIIFCFLNIEPMLLVIDLENSFRFDPWDLREILSSS